MSILWIKWNSSLLQFNHSCHGKNHISYTGHTTIRISINNNRLFIIIIFFSTSLCGIFVKKNTTRHRSVQRLCMPLAWHENYAWSDIILVFWLLRALSNFWKTNEIWINQIKHTETDTIEQFTHEQKIYSTQTNKKNSN